MVEKVSLCVKTPAVPLLRCFNGKRLLFFGTQVDPYEKWRCCTKWSPKTLGRMFWCLRNSENCLECFEPISSVIKLFTYPLFLLHNFRALISWLGRGGQFPDLKKSCVTFSASVSIVYFGFWCIEQIVKNKLSKLYWRTIRHSIPPTG